MIHDGLQATAQPGDDARPLLGGLSLLAGRSYDGLSEATDEILRLVTTQFGMRTGYVASIDPAAGRLRVVAVRDEPGGCGVAVGAEVDLLDAY